MIPWATWVVHRAGSTWSGPAACLYDAAARSCTEAAYEARVTAARLGETTVRVACCGGSIVDHRTAEEKHADEHASWTLHTGDHLAQVMLPGVASPWSEPVRLSASDAVYVHAGRREITVVASELHGTDDAVAWYKQAHARSLEATRYRKDAERCVDFYASGKRRGSIKPPHKQTQEWIERVVIYREAHAAEAAAAEIRYAALARLRETIIALGVLDIDTRENPLAAQADVRKRAEALARASHHIIEGEIRQAFGRLRPHVDRIDSALTYGFVPGDVVTLLPAKWDDIQEPRRVQVLAVEVDPPLPGTPEPQHRRVVQVLDRKQWQEHESQGQLRPEVSRLRKD